MKRIAVCAWAGFIAYAVCLFSIGPAGFKSMDRLEAERGRLETNLKELKSINEDLAARVDALQRDRETIAAEGRAYGYIAPGERLVKVIGIAQPQRFHIAGKILNLREAPTEGGFIPLCAALTVALAVFLLGIATQAREGRV
jgi:cell division protein FtsB